ncbi:MAG TPA: cell division protein SepF [Actinobacteria bacterium]|nr:cell division protein SepF [Actinomycetota bacterium]
MAGVWKKTLQYLGLVEDEEFEDPEDAMEPVPARGEAQAPVRRLGRTSAADTSPDRSEATIVRTMPAPARMPSMASIHRAEPKRFNEAREIGERFRQGIPVIVNLQGADDAIARRLVDFASGLVFGLDGKIEMVASRVYLLTPANMEVSAEERERLVEGGFFNQL